MSCSSLSVSHNGLDAASYFYVIDVGVVFVTGEATVFTFAFALFAFVDAMRDKLCGPTTLNGEIGLADAEIILLRGALL